MFGISDVARAAAEYMTTTTRGDERITVTRDDCPTWVADIIREAHGGSLPSDLIFDRVSSIFDAVADADADDADELAYHGTDHEWADGAVDVYTSDRLAWLAASYDHPGYCDDAVAEGLVADDVDIVDRIAGGQYMQARELWASVVSDMDDVRDEWNELYDVVAAHVEETLVYVEPVGVTGRLRLARAQIIARLDAEDRAVASLDALITAEYHDDDDAAVMRRALPLVIADALDAVTAS